MTEGAKVKKAHVRIQFVRELTVLTLVERERQICRDHRIDEAGQASFLVGLDDLAVDLFPPRLSSVRVLFVLDPRTPSTRPTHRFQIGSDHSVEERQQLCDHVRASKESLQILRDAPGERIGDLLVRLSLKVHL
jgi:hypothetical protein